MIESGHKIHSIREDPHKRWKSGMMIHMATGVRTKEYNQFRLLPCISVQEIVIIRRWPYWEIIIDNSYMNAIQEKMLIENDGFSDIELFLKFFIPEINPYAKWTGKIIHWTDKKY